MACTASLVHQVSGRFYSLQVHEDAVWTPSLSGSFAGYLKRDR